MKDWFLRDMDKRAVTPSSVTQQNHKTRYKKLNKILVLFFRIFYFSLYLTEGKRNIIIMKAVGYAMLGKFYVD